MGGLVEDTNKAKKFNEVSELVCEDKKRFLECKVKHSSGENVEGKFTAQDLVIEDAEVEELSTSANKINTGFSNGTECKLFDENGVLRCE